MGIFQKIFGSRNQRELRKLQPIVDRINGLEPTMKAKSQDELKAMTPEFKRRIDKGESLDSILPEAYAVVREAARRRLGMRHYDVQMIGGIVLHSGKIAEMRTGEGKTLVATLPTYLNALAGQGVHVVTVNDYLAKRDAEWMGRIHGELGLTTGVIVHGLDDIERQNNYNCDITYGQNNEFGFDYLRDNMKKQPDRMVQRGLYYAVVDEVDSILIDEARTPLIISGSGEESADLYVKIDRLIPRLKREVDYTVDEKAHSVMLTDDGVERIEKLLNVDNLYEASNIQLVHHVNQALRAHTLYKRNVNYLVNEENKVVIISEDTGRAMPGRRWSDGLHQAIEAKEGVKVEEENQTLATVTFQNYFRLYKKLCGMTGTADTEAEELNQIYKLDVTVIPTNKPMVRKDQPDLVYKNEAGKFRAVVTDVEDCHKRGQPVLIGTVSVEKSEVVANLLRAKGLPFSVLNAKQHQREAAIVAQAGRKGAITIATNMAGRGTDILLGGNPDAMAKDALAEEKAKLAETAGQAQPAKPAVQNEGEEEMIAPYRGAVELAVDEQKRFDELLAQYKAQCEAEREEVLASGGLKIIGTERHESRRVDNQLRGRAGRQGDPGASRFYLSLQDDLLRIFGLDRMTGIMERLGLEEDVPIESPMVTRSIENAQKKVEGRNFDQRKNVLEYDDVMNQQRKTIYALRRQILEGRYHREPTEDEVKAGIEPEPVTQSGDWTIESVSPEVRRVLGGQTQVHRLVPKAKADDKNHGGAPAFDPQAAIQNGEITLPSGQSFEPGDAVVYRAGDELDIEPLTDGDTYYIVAGSKPGTVGLARAASEARIGNKLPLAAKKGMIGFLKDRVAERDAALARGESVGDTRPGWRVLRAEVWRQFGVLLDFEKRYDLPRAELLDWATREVAASLIQQRERLHDLADARMAAVIDRVLSPEVPDDEWDWDELEDALEEQFATQFEINHGTPDEVGAQVWPKIEERLAEREKELSRAWLMYFLRDFSLTEIDEQWIEHLKTMDALREGIGLQGYGQKDPKKEYKKIGFDMFREMMDRIQANTITKLFRVQIQQQEQQVPQIHHKERQLEEHGVADKNDDEAASTGEAAAGNAAQGQRRGRGAARP
ncbi:MAG TPA: preprotein translocase subunit SecA, partial [Kofleriaceae bacterium]|nr:preprotein translocase subunit SecA [Kofleriaceae bacterium]